jgi:hypothetical protein
MRLLANAIRTKLSAITFLYTLILQVLLNTNVQIRHFIRILFIKSMLDFILIRMKKKLYEPSIQNYVLSYKALQLMRVFQSRILSFTLLLPEQFGNSELKAAMQGNRFMLDYSSQERTGIAYN